MPDVNRPSGFLKRFTRWPQRRVPEAFAEIQGKDGKSGSGLARWRPRGGEGVLRESTGANVAAALRVAERLGSDRTVVALACDSGLKHLSTELYSGEP